MKSQSQNQSANPDHGLIFRRISDVAARPINWLWPGRIARGKITVLAGHPGLGKSQAALDFGATVTVGKSWPVNGGCPERGAVIILSAEDEVSDTIRPRLEAAGADLDQCYILDAVRGAAQTDRPRSFSLTKDMSALAALMAKLGNVALIVIDPITAYLGNVDSHKNTDVRAALAPLTDLAAKYDVAVLAISHLRKSSDGSATMAVSGSLAFVAAPRAAYLIARDPHQHDRRLFVPLKNNLGSDMTGYAYSVEQVTLPSGIVTSRIVWEDKLVEITADEAMTSVGSEGEPTKIETAITFLQEMLSGGTTPQKKIEECAKDLGLHWATIRRASVKMGVTKRKVGFGANGQWEWSLPMTDEKQASAA